MPSPIPDLKLTFGQLAWSINRGRPADNILLDQLRYLRQLGIPLTEEEKGVGRGNRISYNFYHLIECGLGVLALRRGMKPREIAKILIEHRPEMRRWFRKVYLSLPEHVVDFTPLRKIEFDTYMGSFILELHTRFSDRPGAVELIGDVGVRNPSSSPPPIDEDNGLDSHRIQLPIIRFVAGWVAFARSAPATPPGRKPATA